VTQSTQNVIPHSDEVVTVGVPSHASGIISDSSIDTSLLNKEINKYNSIENTELNISEVYKIDDLLMVIATDGLNDWIETQVESGTIPPIEFPCIYKGEQIESGERYLLLHSLDSRKAWYVSDKVVGRV